MSFTAELSFFKNVLHQLHIPCRVFSNSETDLYDADLGLRRRLNFTEEVFSESLSKLESLVKPNLIYRILDEFFCNYFLLLLPEEQQNNYLLVGPYLTEEVDSDRLLDLMSQKKINRDWKAVFDSYFRRVTVLRNEDILLASLNALGESLWGVGCFHYESFLGVVPERWIPLTEPPVEERKDDTLSELQRIEHAYDAENRLIKEISLGHLHRVELMLSGFSESALEKRSADPTRNARNYTVILNTLMRKASELGGVHPLYIDRLSSEFAAKIEQMSTWKQFTDLWMEMARKYCFLVQQHADKNYSPIVQKVIVRIDFDLTADLSLNANAAALNINASYLSTVFKKETGQTLTEYVNKKRMQNAIYLLTTTNLSISQIGQRCGIHDDNYFTKIFKKHTGKTPKQFRQENLVFKRAERNV